MGTESKIFYLTSLTFLPCTVVIYVKYLTINSLDGFVGEVVNLFCILPGHWNSDDAVVAGHISAVRGLICSIKSVVDQMDRGSRIAECYVGQYINIPTTQRSIFRCLWWFWSITRYVVK